jgi:hypothetical protein
VIDGGRGIRKALTDVFGDLVVVQRCQVHKKRNVLDHSTGVCPRGAQVRTRWGRSLSPLSSIKTMVRRSLSAFF